MWQKIALFVILIRILIFYTVPPSLAGESDDSEFCSTGIEKKVEKRIGDYRIRISYAHERMCQHLEIFKRGKIVFHVAGADDHYFLGGKWTGGLDNRYIMKLTGHGTQLVISKWTGGAHCCMSLIIFDLTEPFKKIA